MIVCVCVYISGSAAEDSGLEVGDILICVNGLDVFNLSHVDLVGVIKKVRMNSGSPLLFSCKHAVFLSLNFLFGCPRLGGLEKW